MWPILVLLPASHFLLSSSCSQLYAILRYDTMANPVAAAYDAYIQAIQTRPEAMLALQANSKHSKVFLPSFWSQDRFSMLRKSSPSPGSPTIHTLATLKGQCHEIFRFWFFSSISFPPAIEYPIRTVSNFFENSRRYSQLKVVHRCR